MHAQNQAALLDDLPSGSYGMQSAAGSATLQVVDNLLSTVAFFLALVQQQQLDRSIYYVPLVAGILFAITLLAGMQEYMQDAAARDTYHRHGLATMLSKLVTLVMAYLLGILARSLAACVTNGPARDGFDITLIVVAFIVLVLFLVRIYHVTFIVRHRIDIIRWLPVA